MKKSLVLAVAAIAIGACSPGDQSATDTAEAIDPQPVAPAETVIVAEDSMGGVCASLATALEVSDATCSIVELDGNEFVSFAASDITVPVNRVARGDTVEASTGAGAPNVQFDEATGTYRNYTGVFLADAPSGRNLCVVVHNVSLDRDSDSFFLTRSTDTEAQIYNVRVSEDGEPRQKRFENAVLAAGTSGVFAITPREANAGMVKIEFTGCELEL